MDGVRANKRTPVAHHGQELVDVEQARERREILMAQPALVERR